MAECNIRDCRGVARHEELETAKARMLAEGALGAVMSGSGSSVIGLARDRAHARALAAGFEGAEAVVGPPSDAA